MKIAVVLVLVALIAVVSISGCTQTTPTGELTADQIDENAYGAVEQEMEDMLNNMNSKDLENELLGEV